MRIVLLAIALPCSLASAVMNVANVPRGLLVAGLGVVAVVFVVLIGVRIRRVSAAESPFSGACSVTRMPSLTRMDGTPNRVPAPVDRDAGERRVA
jgi:hypothetical protein